MLHVRSVLHTCLYIHLFSTSQEMDTVPSPLGDEGSGVVVCPGDLQLETGAWKVVSMTNHTVPMPLPLPLRTAKNVSERQHSD